ncbi:ATP-dependent DNA ligase [Flaviflagellibacter deserti]|uniref:DNA ligase (ATP) n=1 Tax=Flaviflagellibacter deserti TaxID=2267266 RepID=A0ABV9Z2L3_9HYPH
MVQLQSNNPETSGRAVLDQLSIDTPPMEARAADVLPGGPGWQFEPKWDGFRCLAHRSGGEIDLRAKSGKPLARYFPEVAALLRSLSSDRFVLDGELVVPVGEELSFDALQMRLHPAESRVRKLSVETPAEFILFDMLVDMKGVALTSEPLLTRRAALEIFWNHLQDKTGLRLSPFTRSRDEARNWLDHAGGALDGVVAKRLDGAYLAGERAMLKVKHLQTADCVVGGFRYAQGKREVGSLLLGLYDDAGLLHHVGFTSGFADFDRAVLTRQLESMIQPPGFTGRAPGGPSRWSTERSGEFQPLRPSLVAEVRYDHVTGNRFRHGTKFMRWRPDKAPVQCRFDQLGKPLSPGELAVLLTKV